MSVLMTEVKLVHAWSDRAVPQSPTSFHLFKMRSKTVQAAHTTIGTTDEPVILGSTGACGEQIMTTSL